MPAASVQACTVLHEKVPPGCDKGQQPNPQRWPGRLLLSPAEYPFDVAQVRLHPLPENPA